MTSTDATFPVEWRRLFRSLTLFLSVAILVPLLLFLLIRHIMLGWDSAKTFEHLSPAGTLLLLAACPVFSMGVAFLFAQVMRLASITIRDGRITGRNYWLLKRTIPLTEITQWTFYSNNGINAFVLHSRDHGQVYISEHTERLPELLELLKPYLPQEPAA
jgi:hypothetical protein